MEVVLSKNATKQYDKLDKSNRIKIHKKLTFLESQPNVGKKLTGELNDLRSLHAWPYRIIYEINTKANRVEIHKIAHRQGAYN